MNKHFLLLVAFATILMTFSLVSAATTSGTLGVSTGGGNIGGCQEDWSSSFWSACENNQETFICIQTNPLCDSENLKPAQCGDTRSCGDVTPPENNNNGGGGGGGGGSSGGGGGIVTTSISQGGQSTACIESWSCGAWSNVKDACGTRECSDSNACGTTDLKPETSRECPSALSTDGITFFFSGVGNFVKSRTGGIILFIVIAVGLIMLARASSKKPAATPTMNS